jgi:uncharacterized membrane protein YhfC
MVPTLSILFMAITLLISAGLPMGLFLYWRRTFSLKIVPALVGAAAFSIFALVLERILHAFVLKPSADGSIPLMTDSPALFVLYAIFAAGIFEESARLISFSCLKRGYEGAGTALSYGIGHGGIEAIILVSPTMISHIAFCISINSGNAAALGDSPQVAEAVNTLAGMDSYLFLMGGVERTAAMAAHISLSVLVWLAVNKRKAWLFPSAIALHALVNLPVALSKIRAIDNVLIIEAIVSVLAAALVFIAIQAGKKFNWTANSRKRQEQD